MGTKGNKEKLHRDGKYRVVKKKTRGTERARSKRRRGLLKSLRFLYKREKRTSGKGSKNGRGVAHFK